MSTQIGMSNASAGLRNILYYIMLRGSFKLHLGDVIIIISDITVTGGEGICSKGYTFKSVRYVVLHYGIKAYLVSQHRLEGQRSGADPLPQGNKSAAS